MSIDDLNFLNNFIKSVFLDEFIQRKMPIFIQNVHEGEFTVDVMNFVAIFYNFWPKSTS